MLEDQVEANNIIVDTFSPQRNKSKDMIYKVTNLTINNSGNNLIDKVENLTIKNVVNYSTRANASDIQV